MIFFFFDVIDIFSLFLSKTKNVFTTALWTTKRICGQMSFNILKVSCFEWVW